MLEDELVPYIFNINKEVLNNLNLENNYCIFDLETTGLFSAFSEIIEIGYVIIKKGKLIIEKEILIRPEKKISEEIFAN